MQSAWHMQTHSFGASRLPRSPSKRPSIHRIFFFILHHCKRHMQKQQHFEWGISINGIAVLRARSVHTSPHLAVSLLIRVSLVAELIMKRWWTVCLQEKGFAVYVSTRRRYTYELYAFISTRQSALDSCNDKNMQLRTMTTNCV